MGADLAKRLVPDELWIIGRTVAAVVRGSSARRWLRRQQPVKIRTEKAYFSADDLARRRGGCLVPRIARPGIKSSERLGRHRWKTERSIAWPFGFRRLTVRYARTAVTSSPSSAWPQL
ncbi:hypothetical protein [Streptomyces sp. Tue6028]|uniref:hypothetical protein n=1 Tax=Streptomyces sp. Tue6028 TaxID=2036037 RepID=UPI003EC01F8A